MAFVDYPSVLENKAWQKAKSVLAGKTGIGDKLDELKEAHEGVTAAAFLPNSLLQTQHEVDDWKKIVDPEVTKAGKLQKLLVTFSQFANTKAGDLKKQKTCPSKTRELVEKMSGTAKKLALDVGVCMSDVAKLIEKAEAAIAKAQEPDDSDLPAQLKAAKTSPRKFVVAIGKVPGLVITKSGVTGAHREEAKKLAGGGGKLIDGGVTYENAKYVFELDDKPPNGLARALKKAIALQTKTNVKVMVRGGGVAVDDDADVEDTTTTAPQQQSQPSGQTPSSGTSQPKTDTPPVKPTTSQQTAPTQQQGTTQPQQTTPQPTKPQDTPSDLSDIQQALLKLGINHGAMDSAGAVPFLKGAPVGAWLIRYSPNQKQCIISKVVAEGKVTHFFSNVNGKDLTLPELVSHYHLEPSKVIKPGQKTGGTTAPTTGNDPALQNAHAKVQQILDLCAKSLKELGPPFVNEIKQLQTLMQTALLHTDVPTVLSEFESGKKTYLEIINKAKNAPVDEKQKLKAKLKKDIFLVKKGNGKSTTPNKLVKSPSFAAKIAKTYGISQKEAQEILDAIFDELTNETLALLPKGFKRPHGDRNTVNPMVPDQARPKLTLEEAQAVFTYSTNDYKEINPPLWTGKVPPPPHDKTHKLMQDAFAKTKPFDVPVKVTRGLDFTPGKATDDFLQKFKDAAGTDNAVYLTGYISSGTAGTPSDFKGNIEFVILAKQALDLQPYSAFPKEKELLLNHNTPVFVISCVQKGNKWTVEVEQSLPETN